MRLLHRDVEFDLSSKRTSDLQIKYKSRYSLIYIIPFL